MKRAARTAAVVAVLGCLVGLLAPAAGARPSAGPSAEVVAYAKAIYPADKRFVKALTRVGSAVDKAEKRSDASNARRFASLAKQVRTSHDRIDDIDAPKQFAAKQAALTRAISRLVRELDAIAKAARTHDKGAATRAGVRLGRDVQAIQRARKALDAALQRAAAPGDTV